MIKLSIMMYHREIKNKILSISKQFPAIILTGARQTGKTTLLKSLFTDFNYISLDLPSDAEMAENDPEAFLTRNKPPLIIDEAQYAPAIFRHLKMAIDKNRDLKGQYLLTGSQKFNLMKEVSDSLAGRCAWLELESLSIKEIVQKTDYQFLKLDEVCRGLTRGFLPELWANQELDQTVYYRSYLATYLERDVRQILNITSLRDFERFIRVCAARTGQILNKSDMAKDVGVTLNTINQWLSVLEASNQITLLEPYFQNIGKRVVKSPKLYFNEIGLLSFLLNLKPDNVAESPFIGHLWENFVFSELNKKIKNQADGGTLWFYRDNQNNEVDFLWEHDNRLDFMEVKWTQKPSEKAYKSLLKVYKLFLKANMPHLKIGNSYILCRTPTSYPMGETMVENLSFLN